MFNIQLQGCDGKRITDKSDNKRSFPDKTRKTRVKSLTKKINEFNSIKSNELGSRKKLKDIWRT